MNEEEYLKAIQENIETGTEIGLRQAGQALIDLYDSFIDLILDQIGLEEYKKKDIHKKKMLIAVRIGFSEQTSKSLDDLWNKFRGNLAHNRAFVPSANEIEMYLTMYEVMKQEIKERIEEITALIEKKQSFEDLFMYLYSTRLNALKMRIKELSSQKELETSFRIPIPIYEKTLSSLESGQAPNFETLLTYERLLTSLFQLYEDPQISKKLTAELKRMRANLQNSYVQIHECSNCGNGFIGVEKDNTPGFRERDNYWCKYCEHESQLGTMVFFDDFPPRPMSYDIPKEFLSGMMPVGRDNEEIFDRLWISSHAIVRPGGMVIVGEVQDESINIAQRYCLLDLESSSLGEIDWNEFARKHREFLSTKEGTMMLKEAITNSRFGNCPDCGLPLLPVGRRNKPYITGIWLICPCTGKVIEEIDEVDSAIYGRWVDLKEPEPAWIAEITEKCPKEK